MVSWLPNRKWLSLTMARGSPLSHPATNPVLLPSLPLRMKWPLEERYEDRKVGGTQRGEGGGRGGAWRGGGGGERHGEGEGRGTERRRLGGEGVEGQGGAHLHAHIRHSGHCTFACT